MTGAPDPVAIGWREFIQLPEWKVRSVRAKADTGAKTSAVDVDYIDELSGDRVRFGLVTRRPSDGDPTIVNIEADVVRRTVVKSSIGASHDRIVVATRMCLGPIDKMIEVSLVCRKRMLCRMLLGRSSLAPDMLVDCSRKYVFGRRPKAAGESP